MTREDFAADCLRNADQIFVRAYVGGRWQSVALASLTAAEQADWIERWWSKNPNNPERKPDAQ